MSSFSASSLSQRGIAMLFCIVRCRSSGDILMSVTIRPGFATIPLAENGFGMDFPAFSSERAHKLTAFFAASMASDCFSPFAVRLKSGIYAVYPYFVEVKTIG
jgi:hypothetical protein